MLCFIQHKLLRYTHLILAVFLHSGSLTVLSAIGPLQGIPNEINVSRESLVHLFSLAIGSFVRSFI